MTDEEVPHICNDKCSRTGMVIYPGGAGSIIIPPDATSLTIVARGGDGAGPNETGKDGAVVIIATKEGQPMSAQTDNTTVACTVCGKQTPMLGTKLCDACWEKKQHSNPGAQTDKQRVIAELLKRYAGAVNPYRNIADAAYEAGYAAALERAAQVAEAHKVDGYITYNNACTRIAKGIRALKEAE